MRKILSLCTMFLISFKFIFAQSQVFDNLKMDSDNEGNEDDFNVQCILRFNMQKL